MARRFTLSFLALLGRPLPVIGVWCLLLILWAGPEGTAWGQAPPAGPPTAVGGGVTLRGRVIDEATREGLPGATIQVVGTYKGTATDIDGNYTITGLKAGDYSVRVSFVGYTERVFTGIRIGRNNETTMTLNASLREGGRELNTVEIVGERQVVDLESGRSEVRIGASDIQEMTARSVQDVVALQAGVSVSPDGLQIRGGRVYETQYVIEGINAQDPLAGTGFGVQVSSAAVQDVTVITGGAQAEYNGNSGVILTRIREGGDRPQAFARWQRDNLNFARGRNTGSSWNTDVVDVNFGTPIAGTNKKLRLFTSLQANLTDTYFRVVADQLNSSILDNTRFWAPRQDNQWAATAKLSYQVSPATKVTLTNQGSLLINQNTRTLQIIGFNAIVTPGFQYGFTEQPDNATTYTHKSNLTVINVQHRISSRFSVGADLGRMFVNLRADANGRPFRTESVDQILDPASVVTAPVELFNPSDPVVFVVPGNGFINNGGISRDWHDHWVEEYTVKYRLQYASPNRVHQMVVGHEHRQQAMQWVDVTRPWVGAPITLADGTRTPSRSIGSSSDVWAVRPRQGAFWYQDEIRYKGIIASLGSRLEYWAPGDLAERAVRDPRAPVIDQVREDFRKQTFSFLGNDWKARLLPRLNVSFPVTENNVLNFNYSHSMRLPHPRFVYAGLDPVFQDRSFLADLGNPNLNPEVAVGYELGLKSQITRDLGLTLTAFYRDQFDYIVNRTLIFRDPTGRLVEKTFAINQDYARIRGAEVMAFYRLSRRVRLMGNVSLQAATGKSSTALESRLQIRNTGQVNLTREQYLAWDRPADLKGTITLVPDSSDRLFGLRLKGIRLFVATQWKSGLRYTPFRSAGLDEQGRERWEPIEEQPFSRVGSAWFWTDFRLTRDFVLAGRLACNLSIEVLNAFNNFNAQIINPVTGTAWRQGDPLPYAQRDPNFPGPRDRGLPPGNPARYLQPRQVLFGFGVTI